MDFPPQQLKIFISTTRRKREGERKSKEGSVLLSIEQLNFNYITDNPILYEPDGKKEKGKGEKRRKTEERKYRKNERE